MMGIIFAFSSRASNELPNFQSADQLIKKGGHSIGYALLSVTYWRGLRLRSRWQWLAWLMALAYSTTDEFHQSFVPGRHPSPTDVLLFDNLGAMLGLLIFTFFRKKTWKRLTAGSIQ